MKEEWDSIDLERIEMATDPSQVLKALKFNIFLQL